MRKIFILLGFLIFNFQFSIFNSVSAFAETDCVKVYGGGQGFCLPKPTPTPTPTPKVESAFPKPPTTTKGGQPILSSPNQTASPATGPEALILIPLLSSGVIGYLLRKRAL